MSVGSTYRMAGNFRGVLLFVTFVVDSAVMKFHLQKLMTTSLRTRSSTKGSPWAGAFFQLFTKYITPENYLPYGKYVYDCTVYVPVCIKVYDSYGHY